VPALTFSVSTNFALANFLASCSVGNVSVTLVMCVRCPRASSNETYHVPWDFLAMRPSRGLGPSANDPILFGRLPPRLRAVLMVPVDRLHDADARKHCRAARHRDQDQSAVAGQAVT
jgi:hypothetical protein